MGLIHGICDKLACKASQLVLMCWLTIWATSCISSIQSSRTCPRGCDCNEQVLITRCDKTAQLDYVPHTLNPAVKELYLSDNNIRRINSAFEVYKNLVLLDLSANSIQNLGEKSFFANHKIEVLWLKNNNISDLMLNSFSGLNALRRLDLSYNQLEIVNGSVFQHLKWLESLDLSYNNLHSFSEDTLVGLTNLVYLNLSNNAIVRISSHLFHHVPRLVNLNASYNQLTQLVNDQFDSLNKLTTLDVRHCFISQIDQFAFRGLTSLLYLYLDNNELKNIPTAAFVQCGSLQMLSVGHNQFQSLPTQAFATLKQLKYLYITNNSLLTNIHSTTFYGLDNLELLEISNNEMLQHISRNTFDNLFSLSSLVLSNNNFTTLAIDLITRYKKADLYLDVRGNPLNCNCSLEWLNHHFIRMFNKTISANPEYLQNNNYAFPIYNMDALLNNNSSDIIIQENGLEVTCATPFALENKLVIKLHKDKFGCFVIESFIPIIVGGFIGVILVTGVFVLSIIRCRYQLSGFVKNQLYADNSRTNQMDLYHKPEFVFFPNVNNRMDYNTLYKANPGRGLEDIAVRYPLKMTPITEL